jgi:hypothetical protein
MNIEEELKKNRFAEPPPFLEQATMAAALRGLSTAPRQKSPRHVRSFWRWGVALAPLCALMIGAVEDRVTRAALGSNEGVVAVGGGAPSVTVADDVPARGLEWGNWPAVALAAGGGDFPMIAEKEKTNGI